MQDFSYTTIAAPAEGIYKEKGSKFFSYAFPVETEQQVKEHLDRLRKQYFDARHHCFAWMLGFDAKSFRAYDDGEPNHSAGDPILGQIRSRNLTNVLVVVVRYFGGVKLGVSGLIAAYRNAAQEALSNASVITKELSAHCTMRYQYAHTPEVMRLVKELDLRIVDQRFLEACEMDIEVLLRNKDKLSQRLDLLHATGFPISYDFTG